MASVRSACDFKGKTRKASARKSPGTTSSLHVTALEKLRKHPEFKHLGEKKCSEMARDLTDKEYIMPKYFSEIAYNLAEARIEERIDEDAAGVLTLAERREAEKRAKWRVEDVAKFEVKLLLRQVDSPMAKAARTGAKLLELTFGALHAALLINGTILVEWNNSSLVIPDVNYDPDDLSFPFVHSVLHLKNQVEAPTDIRKEEIDLIFKATADKKAPLDALVKVISRYNGMYYYTIVRRNCQNFVEDAMKEMGCENYPKFEGRLEEYYSKLEAGQSRTDFENHGQLDEFVKDTVLAKNVQKVSSHTKEYLLAQYCEFHLKERTSSPYPSKWECSYGDACMMPELDNCIDKEAMLLHKFLRERT